MPEQLFAMGPQKQKAYHLRLLLLGVLVLGFALSIPAAVTIWRGGIFAIQSTLCVPAAIFTGADLLLKIKLIDSEEFATKYWPNICAVLDIFFAFVFFIAVLLQWIIPDDFNTVGVYANILCLTTVLIFLYFILTAHASKLYYDLRRFMVSGQVGGPKYCARCRAEIDLEEDSSTSIPEGGHRSVWSGTDRSVDPEAADLLVSRDQEQV